MKENLEILNEWTETLSNYDKLSLGEAKALYQKFLNEKDPVKKEEYYNNLIYGVLHIVPKFIINNNLTYLNGLSYDMNDIISSINEIIIKLIGNGELLKLKSYSEIFNNEFFYKLTENLGITKRYPYNNTSIDIDTFTMLLSNYIKLKENNIDYNYLNFLEYLKNNENYRHAYNILSNNKEYASRLCRVFDGIIASFKLDDLDSHISKTRIRNLLYILYSNGLDYIDGDLDSLKVSDSCESVINEETRKKCIDIIENSVLNNNQKEILLKRFGFEDGQYYTLEKAGAELGLKKSTVEFREKSAIWTLRRSSALSEFKKLM